MSKNIYDTNNFVLRLFLFFRLKDLKKRLEFPKIFYEEVSWYDLQVWDKPMFIIRNDKLLNLFVFLLITAIFIHPNYSGTY